ncbi:GSCFA domain-containing protein [Winogradskyella sp.]|uniref:GSCFA domain-containing protein n=1 Tax=Winogradskyella sp. TaxID=1883156 RepID=UPI003BAA386E
MKLQTQIPLNPQKLSQLDYNSKVVLLGSCFSENMGSKFEYYKFQTAINPFGILFHPLAIERLVTRAINSDYYLGDELIFHNEQWSCLDAHSTWNRVAQDDLINILNGQLDNTLQQLKSATHVIVTLGTSWVYRHIASDRIVANCHKVPQKQFLKELLSVNAISQSLEAMVALIRGVNPKVNFIFTVSPVRHLKDGFIENTRSKSHLIAAVHDVVDPRQHLYYFPSYEIMMDELRDYRFYNTDMLHPNALAIDYIWGKFKTVWLMEEALEIMDAVASIQSKKAHRPFNPKSEKHLAFLNQLQLDIKALEKAHPNITFDK